MVSHSFFSTKNFFLIAGIVMCAAHLTFTTPTNAQTEFIDAGIGKSLRVTLSPQHPKAFQQVHVSVEDFSQDINNLSISWSLNGKVIEKGLGLRTFTFETGALGSVSNISINMGGVSHTIAVRPTDIDLMWQANSYVPPFYEGRALHSNQDPLTVIAEPFFLTSNGTRLDPNTLTYKWTQNGKVAQNSSGYGKRTFTITPSILSKAITVGVEVSSASGDYRATAQTSIGETAPDLVVYENHSLYGVRSEKALNGGTFSLGATPETTFIAVPFYFSTGTRVSDSNITYTWSQNGVRSDKASNNIIFRAPAEGAGSSSVTVQAKSLTNMMQGAIASFTIDFAKAQNAGTPAANSF